MSNLGMFSVSTTEFAKALHLPEDTEILNVQWDSVWRKVRVFAKHPAFLPSPEGVPLMESHVVITTYSRVPEAGELIQTFTGEYRT